MARNVTKVLRFPTGQVGYKDDQLIQIVGQGATQIVTASATAGTSATFSTGVEAIEIVANTAFWYKFDGTADKAGAATYVPANAIKYSLIGASNGTVSCIQDSGDAEGTSQAIVSITELALE